MRGVLKDMGLVFKLYSDHKFSNTRSVWLKSVCHYISKGYHSAAAEIFNVLAMVSSRGDPVSLSVLVVHTLDAGARQGAASPTSAVDCA